MAKKTVRKTTRLRTLSSNVRSQVLEEESTQKRAAPKVVRAKKQSTETIEDTTQTGEKKKTGRKQKEPVEEEATVTKDKKKCKNGSCKGKSISPETEAAVAKFIDHATKTSLEVLRNEFKTVVEKSKEVTNKPHSNHGTARHPDIPCFEDTRVVILSPETSAPTDDFVHASRVKLDNADRDYVASQAPKDNQLEVFWRMIFQESCPVVICVTPFSEEGVTKCDEFWPMENGQYKYYGKMFINNKKVEHQERYSVYTLEVLPEGCSNSSVTRLVHYMDWPDKAVAVSGRVILRILKWIKTLENGTACVISSAGVGRAGTFIGIDATITKLFKGNKINIVDLVVELRQQRAMAVDNELQYLFIYSTILDYIRAKIPKYMTQINKFFQSIRDM